MSRGSFSTSAQWSWRTSRSEAHLPQWGAPAEVSAGMGLSHRSFYQACAQAFPALPGLAIVAVAAGCCRQHQPGMRGPAVAQLCLSDEMCWPMPMPAKGGDAASMSFSHMGARETCSACQSKSSSTHGLMPRTN